MNTADHEFINLPHYLSIVGNYWNELGWIFRGQGKDIVQWPLIPKAGRPEYFMKATSVWEERNQTSSDLGRFNMWREQAVAYCDVVPSNDLDCLAFAQHYGLATRLLDWSNNPLVALFFAAESELESDGAVFCYLPNLIIQRDKALMLELGVVTALRPPPFDRRILAQSGVFTFHPDPRQPLIPSPCNHEDKNHAPEGVDLVTIRVKADQKQIIQRQLSSVGISRKTLFPDLDGLSHFINWDTRRTAAFRARRANKDNTEGMA